MNSEFSKEPGLWLGLTGGIACGKSTVAALLAKKGFAVLDADQMAHLCLQTPEAKRAVREIFGDDIFIDGEVDRPSLGRRVFKNTDLLHQLEAILHPCVRQKIFAERTRLMGIGATKIIYDVPLLFEKNLQGDFDATICVVCSEDIQLARLMSRNGLSRKEASLRIQAQMPLPEKVKLADFVIENSGDLTTLEKRVADLILQIKNVTNV